MSDTDRSLLHSKAIVPDHVLFQEVSGNSALLNLETEIYFGLDHVGTQMWEAMEKAETIGAAALSLTEVFDAPLETLERDIARLVTDLRAHGLIELG